MNSRVEKINFSHNNDLLTQRNKRYFHRIKRKIDTNQNGNQISKSTFSKKLRRSDRFKGNTKKKIIIESENSTDTSETTNSTDDQINNDMFDPPIHENIEKILGKRKILVGKNQKESFSYFIKLKGYSYSKCVWWPKSKIESNGTWKKKLSRYEYKSYKLVDKETDGNSLFDPLYLIPEKVISEKKDTRNNNLYLVKWNSLSMMSCTWEENINGNLDEIIKIYHKFNVPKRKIEKSPLSWKDNKSLPENRPKTLNNKASLIEWQPPIYKNGNTLKYPYQYEGVKWLIYNWHHSRNCILADEMGLGKTIQTICLIEYLTSSQKLRAPFMIIAPKSTLPHWQREFNRWTDLNALIYDGTKECRSIIEFYEFYYENSKNNERIKYVTKFDVIIISYTMVMVDRSVLSTFRYSLIVVDEAHRLKNVQSKLFEILKTFKYYHSIFLTGTPLQNNLKELWALLHFLEPIIFSDLDEFERDYGPRKDNIESDKVINSLHAKVLKPFMLRRLKDDVEKSLKPPKEIIIWLKMSLEQKSFFRAIYEKNTDFLFSYGVKNAPSLLNIHMQLRLCCNHPFGLKGVEERLIKEKNLKTEKEIMEKLINVSTKMDFLDKFLPKMKKEKHKVLIFSQFVLILNIIEDYLIWKGYAYERIDGKITNMHERQNSIDRFNENKDIFIFLLSTRSGGLGINLTSADTVIIYDSDWNPHNDLQAQSRAHRIGQTKEVTIYRLLTKGTYEEIMFEKAGLKLGLEKAILHSWVKRGREIEKGNKGNLNKQELDLLLKFGAYHILKDKEDDHKPQSIEEIMASSQVLDRDSNKSKLNFDSNFSQATFATNLKDELALDDPDFWKKIGLKIAKKAKPGVRERRKIRRNAKNFGNNSTSLTDISMPTDEEMIDSSTTDDDIKFYKWSKRERNYFEESLYKFGYGNWKKIIQEIEFQFSTNKKKDKPKYQFSHTIKEMKKYALGIIKLYITLNPRTAVYFVSLLQQDLYCFVKLMIEKELEEMFDSENKNEIKENSILLSICKTTKDDLRLRLPKKDILEYSKRIAKSMRSIELFEYLELEPSLTTAVFKTKLINIGNNRLKNLERIWIISKIIKFGWKSSNNVNGIEFPNELLSVNVNLPIHWWNQECDNILIKTFHEHGLYNRYDLIKSECSKVKNIKTNSNNNNNTFFGLYNIDNGDKTNKQHNIEKLTNNKINKRLIALTYKLKTQIQRIDRLYKQIKIMERLTIPTIKNNDIKNKTIDKPKSMSYSHKNTFKKFIYTYPLINPKEITIWKISNQVKDINKLLPFEPSFLRRCYLEYSSKVKKTIENRLNSIEENNLEEDNKEEEDNIFGDLSNSIAKKYYKRLTLFENLIKVAKMNNIRQIFDDIPKKYKPKIENWHVPISDYQLIIGIIKYGVGNWKMMKEDNKLTCLFKKTSPKENIINVIPFNTLSIMDIPKKYDLIMQSTRSQKEYSLTSEFPYDFIIVNRADYIIKKVLKTNIYLNMANSNNNHEIKPPKIDSIHPTIINLADDEISIINKINNFKSLKNYFKKNKEKKTNNNNNKECISLISDEEKEVKKKEKIILL